MSEHKKLIQKGEKLPMEAVLLIIRNICALAAAVLFVITLLGGSHHLRGIAYFLGAGAYLMEILEMTDCFKKNPSIDELFMALLFCPLYVLMGIEYLKG